MMVSETMSLTAHPKFILDGIRKQAGSMEKAVLELVMNAIEAQLHNDISPVVNIFFGVDENTGQAKLTVRDLGRGFKSRNEIEQWFAKFGTPHDECPECQETMTLDGDTFVCSCGYKTEGRTWAEFRMGRGQAFSFGRNVWRTGTFCMEYDLETDPAKRSYSKGDGTDHILDFSLQSNLPQHDGCEVVVYLYRNPIGYGYRSIDDFKSKIKHHIEFMEGTITFNGEQINTPASSLNWDIETDDAFFMFGKGSSLSLYNIGAFVKSYSAAHMGVTGVVVSKDKVMVNFARNDVMQSCDVWQRIQIIIRENRIKKVRRASRILNKDERISTLLDLRDGDCKYDEVKGIALFELTDGKRISLNQIHKIRSLWSFSITGDRSADHLMQVGEAICFDDEMLDALDYTGDRQQFFLWLLKVHFEGQRDQRLHYHKDQKSKNEQSWIGMTKFFRDIDSLSSGFSKIHKLLPQDKLSKSERRFLRVMEAFGCWRGRTLCLGVSDTANGWTDGSTYIAFNRKFLKRYTPTSMDGASGIITLAFHELAHDEDDTGTHYHGTEFYKNYHDLTMGGGLWMIGSLRSKMDRQKWMDHDEEVAEKQAKKKYQRDAKLGINQVKKGVTAKPEAKLADGLVHKPEKVGTPKVKKRKMRRRRF